MDLYEETLSKQKCEACVFVTAFTWIMTLKIVMFDQ